MEPLLICKSLNLHITMVSRVLVWSRLFIKRYSGFSKENLRCQKSWIATHVNLCGLHLHKTEFDINLHITLFRLLSHMPFHFESLVLCLHKSQSIYRIHDALHTCTVHVYHSISIVLS